MIKNIHFTILVKINKRQHEFNFLKRSDDLYDGDTADERIDRYYFTMIKISGEWKIKADHLPPWATGNEELIIKRFAESIPV